MSNINITNKKGQLLVSSREVAENFEKEHKHVMQSIRELETSVKNSTNLFIESIYLDSYSREQREYLLTRDGFTLLAMGFTGQKALQWKLKYIEAFNKMEEIIKSNQLDTSKLSPTTQALINIELGLNKLETTVKETKEEIQNLRDVIAINPRAEWRIETNNILNSIGKKLDNYSTARNEVYEALKVRASCRPNVLVNNLKKRALENGMAPSKVDKLNILDVLENDPRLREIYISIVKEMAIKYKVA